MRSCEDCTARAGRPGRLRWVICSLLFAATALNYVDRQSIGILEPVARTATPLERNRLRQHHILVPTRLRARVCRIRKAHRQSGARLGYALAVVIWTVAHVAHAWASSLSDFMIARFAIGLGESGNFPAGLKAVAEWFPKQERALAVGIFNAGANVGAIITPIIVPIITLDTRWRAAFVITGSLTVLWLVVWLAVYRSPRRHRRLRPAELALIESDPPDRSGSRSRGRAC